MGYAVETSAGSANDKGYRPPTVEPPEVNQVNTIEDFLEIVKDDPKNYERWKNDKTHWAPADAPEAEQEKARRDELDYMKSVELGSRMSAFMENLPDTLTQEERRRAINEYLIEQRRILGIKNWP